MYRRKAILKDSGEPKPTNEFHNVFWNSLNQLVCPPVRSRNTTLWKKISRYKRNAKCDSILGTVVLSHMATRDNLPQIALLTALSTEIGENK